VQKRTGYFWSLGFGLQFNYSSVPGKSRFIQLIGEGKAEEKGTVGKGKAFWERMSNEREKTRAEEG